MASNRQWALSPYDRGHTSSGFYSEHPGRSQTAGRQRHASGITRYPTERSTERSPSHRSTHHSHTHHSMSEDHGYNRHREHHADAVSLSRSRSRSRDRDYDDYGRSTHSSHHGSHYSSHSGSLANSQAYSHRGDRNRDRYEDRSRNRHKDLELSHSRNRERDRDYDRDRDRNRDRSRSHVQSRREHDASRRRRRIDNSEYSEYSGTSSDSRSDTSNEYSYSDRDNSEVYSNRNKYRGHGGSPRNGRGRNSRVGHSKDKGKITRSRHFDPDSSPLTDPDDISRTAKFLLILGTVFTLIAYTLIVLVGRGGWRSPNFWFELLFYVFVLICILLYAFDVQRVVDFLSKNLPFTTSRKGYASILVFISIRSWPRTWPVDVTNQIEVHIAGNFFSLAGLIVAFSLYFIE